MNTISTNIELVNFLQSIKGATIVGLTTRTEVRMRKTNNPLNGHKVEKLTTKKCQFGYNYENAVNNRIEKLGGERDFKSEGLKWGEWLVPNKVITHKGKFYARFYTMEKGMNPTTFYLVDGRFANPMEMKTIEEFAYEREESARQSESGLVEHQVQPMNYSFESIESIRVNDVAWDVKIAPEVAVAK